MKESKNTLRTSWPKAANGPNEAVMAVIIAVCLLIVPAAAHCTLIGSLIDAICKYSELRLCFDTRPHPEVIGIMWRVRERTNRALLAIRLECRALKKGNRFYSIAALIN